MDTRNDAREFLIYTAEPGSPGQERLDLLAGLAPDQFVGDVWVDALATPQEGDQRATMATVRFAPGARTARHSHARGQHAHVTDGVARFGGRDGEQRG